MNERMNIRKSLAYVRGNDVLMVVTVKTPNLDESGHPIIIDGKIQYIPVDLSMYDGYTLRAYKQTPINRQLVVESSEMGEDVGTVVIDMPSTLVCGTYSLEFVADRDGRNERAYEVMMWRIVESNNEANMIYNIIEGVKSTDLDISIQVVPAAVTHGENSYEMWRKLPGNENKTLQDFIDEVLDLTTITENARHPDYVGGDNYVYRWNTGIQDYQRTNIYVKGDTGETGPRGMQGEQGIKGDKGDPFTYDDFTPEQLETLKGEKGDTGDTGPQGPQGIQGVKGDKGDAFTYADFTPEQLASLKGEKGDKGDKGDTGEKGDKGETGVKGDKGDAFTYADFTPEQLAALKGEKGDKGETGPQGAQGAQGVKGDTGETGAAGTDGVTPHIDITTRHWFIGETDTGIVAEGLDGTNGLDGTDGQDGTDGITPHIDPTTGNWFIGDTDTGVHAKGDKGDPATFASVETCEDIVTGEDISEHSQEAVNVIGLKASVLKFKEKEIGNLGYKPTEYYTAEEAIEHNAMLDGALNSTDELTTEEAEAYNEAISGGDKTAGDILTDEEAAAYNATLEGAVMEDDPKPAVPHNVRSYVDTETVSDVRYEPQSEKIQMEKNGKTEDIVSLSGKADKTDTVSNITYNSSTGKLQKTINGTTSDVTTIVTSGFRIEYNSTTGIKTLTPVGSATGAFNSTTGIKTITF